ncbi:hypothetical protein H696_03606 [Fonticula alba]|uniref:Endoribonuclease L-PSP/chorismate mutase-like domain-containing protein n=1 Tax=Fonticula alba TaxID=691883 RepID=A0A058Z9F4_FONAL|nr:hypothetical protein H696_03606 [Fonticula alba]KCV70147.1 hypothetical protein H696_03606 [Fonticula alba]|eukprot:XP_009495753.1 hypothetical protein H696_03606 [Fonticula alba]
MRSRPGNTDGVVSPLPPPAPAVATLWQTLSRGNRPGPRVRWYIVASSGPGALAQSNYCNAVQTGNLVFLAGHLPFDKDGKVITGKLGAGMSVEEGQAAARAAALGLVSTLNQHLNGDLERVSRIVKMSALINCTPDFSMHPAVANGASDTMVQVFGSAIGSHARCAAGFISLPLEAAVEVELIVEVSDDVNASPKAHI